MSNVATGAASPFANPRNPGVTLPNRDDSVSKQMSSILTSLNVLGGLRAMLDNVEETKGGATDGGAKMALDASIIIACNRLDTMLQEGSRWSVETLGKLEDRMISLYDQQRQLFEAQTKLASGAAAPHSYSRPQLTRLPDGNWAAILGDPTTPSSVIGIGPNPAAALENFDSVFQGGAVNVPKQYLELYDKELERLRAIHTANAEREGTDLSPDSRKAGEGTGDSPKEIVPSEVEAERKRRKRRKRNAY